MKRYINPAQLIQGLLETLTGLAFLWLSITRNYQYYVTPRTLPYLYFAAVLFLLMGSYSFTKVFKLTHTRRYMHLTVLIIPLLLLAASTYDQGLWQAPESQGSYGSEFNDLAYFEETYTMTTPVYFGRVIHGYNKADQTITIMEAETYFWMAEIYNDPTPFLGYTIRTMGQVVINTPYLASDCFAPTRDLITCCVADMYSIGFPCQYDQIDTLTEGDWVSVTGTLAMVDMEEYQELRIIVDTVEDSPPPEVPYVYAY